MSAPTLESLLSPLRWALQPKTVVCQPELVDEIKALVADFGLADRTNVIAGRFLPEKMVLVINADKVGMR